MLAPPIGPRKQIAEAPPGARLRLERDLVRWGKRTSAADSDTFSDPRATLSVVEERSMTPQERATPER